MSGLTNVKGIAKNVSSFFTSSSSSSITSFILPPNLKYIGDEIFAGTGLTFNLTSFTMPSTLETVGSSFLSGVGKDDTATPLNTNIPESVKSIGQNSFTSSIFNTNTVNNLVYSTNSDSAKKV
jgi:hypothetical protein